MTDPRTQVIEEQLDALAGRVAALENLCKRLVRKLVDPKLANADTDFLRVYLADWGMNWTASSRYATERFERLQQLEGDAKLVELERRLRSLETR